MSQWQCHCFVWLWCYGQCYLFRSVAYIDKPDRMLKYQAANSYMYRLMVGSVTLKHIQDRTHLERWWRLSPTSKQTTPRRATWVHTPSMRQA